KGYYGKVHLEVQSQDTSGCIVNFIDKCDLYWRVGVEFGIVHGWELWQSHQSHRRGLFVKVLEVTGQMVDTNNLVIAFVAAYALWKALGWTPPKPPSFDPKTGCFTFAK